MIIKLINLCSQEHSSLQKFLGLLDAKNMYKIIDELELEANPRLAKVGRVTNDITETLEKSPELFMYKSKGILLSTSSCEVLERGRLKLTFENEMLEGILDGGHNTLAIAKYFISCIDENKSKKVRKWDDLKPIWDDLKDEVLEEIGKEEGLINKFLVPIEIISPIKEDNDFFTDNIFEISVARNNNAELTNTAKANHAGYYEKLSEKLDDAIKDQIEWKTNEADKRIKAQDIVSLALIPIIFLQKQDKLPKSISKILEVSIYNSKAKCINDFTDIMTNSEIGLDENKNIKDPLIDSALDLMKDIPKLFDYVYENFPDAYNGHSSRFGGISCVRRYSKEQGEQYISKKPHTKFYHKEVNYKYPEGFIYPVVVSLHALMEIKDNRVKWRTDPHQFFQDNLAEIIQTYINLIKTNNYDPQKLGKDLSSYQVIEMMINMKMLLQ